MANFCWAKYPPKHNYVFLKEKFSENIMFHKLLGSEITWVRSSMFKISKNSQKNLSRSKWSIQLQKPQYDFSEMRIIVFYLLNDHVVCELFLQS